VSGARAAAPVQVAETREAFEAELIALRLREAGLDPQVLDQSFRQEPLPDVRSFAIVRVLVPAEQAEAARRALAEGQPLPEDAYGDGESE
jgi:Putative prokaryotic signal transducing protein